MFLERMFFVDKVLSSLLTLFIQITVVFVSYHLGIRNVRKNSLQSVIRKDDFFKIRNNIYIISIMVEVIFGILVFALWNFKDSEQWSPLFESVSEYVVICPIILLIIFFNKDIGRKILPYYSVNSIHFYILRNIDKDTVQVLPSNAFENDMFAQGTFLLDKNQLKKLEINYENVNFS